MQEKIKNEAEAWAWLEGFIPTISGYEKLFDLNKKLARELKSDSPSSDNLELIEKEFYDLEESKEIIFSTSTTDRYVNSLEDRQVALNALKTFLGYTNKELEGVLNALLFKKGLRKKLLPEKKAFLELMSEIRSISRKQFEELSETEEKLDNRCRETEQLLIGLDSKVNKAIEEVEYKKDNFIENITADLDVKLEVTKSDVEVRISDLKEGINKEAESAKKRIDNFVEAYKSEIQLQAPVSFWEENKKFHRDRAKNFGIASIAISPIIFFAMITWIGWEVLSSEKVLWGKIGVVVFATSLAVWLIRILVRMYLSHNHLELSSQERIIMTKSYLALLSEGGASSPEERQLVLQSIFRPAATGIINDDAAPPSVIELINKMPMTKK